MLCPVLKYQVLKLATVPSDPCVTQHAQLRFLASVSYHLRCICRTCPLPQEPGVTYLVDVVEQAGLEVVQAAYWDFGDWSDLWAEYKVGLGCGLHLALLLDHVSPASAI